MKEEFSDRRGKLFHFNSCLTNRQVIEDLGIVFILFLSQPILIWTKYTS